MKACWISLGWFFAGSLAVIAGVFSVWVLVEQPWSAGAEFPVQKFVHMFWGAAASFLVMTLAALVIRQRVREGQGNESRFQHLLEAAPDAIIIMDKASRIVLVNKQTEQLFGYGRQELLGQPVDRLVVRRESSVPKPGSADYSLAASSSPEGRQPGVIGRCKNGREFPVEISFNPLETEGDCLVINSIRDVSERNARERRRATRQHVRRLLAESEALEPGATRVLQATCDGLGWEVGALWLIDPPTQELRCTVLGTQSGETCPCFEVASREATRGPGEGLVGQVWWTKEPVWLPDLHQVSDNERLAAAAAEGLQSAVAVPITYGSELLGVLEWFSREAREPDSHLLETLGLIASQLGHFLKHRWAEEAVRESEARKAAILEAALDAIITVDHQGRIVEFNPAAERTFGYRRADVLGREMSGLIIPPGLRGKKCYDLAHQLTSGDSLALDKRVEMTAMRADGSEFSVELAVAQIHSDGPPLFTGFIRDISERKQAEEALRNTEEKFRQAQKMEAVGRLAGGVAHDFNNLLTVITGYSHLLLETLPRDNPAREPVEEINKAADRATTLTRQLLAFGRKQMLSFKVLDLNTVVTDMGKLLQRLIGEDVNLLTVLAPDLPPVKVDPGQIEQVLMNLAVNARDAMPQGGQLIIETTATELDETYTEAYPELRPGPYVMLAVTDTGCGMDEQVQARAFEPFFTTKEVGKGTGLGLATVYGIIKQSGGHIAVYSEPGQGTTFKIYLPYAEEPVSGLLPRPSRLLPMRGTETILLVEDEDKVRTLTRQILQKQGYKVLEARHGVEALRLCEQAGATIHLMVTDVIMPEMSGPQLAHCMRERHPELKVLFLSGYTDSALIHNGVLDLDKNFLHKPFTPDALARKVREVLAGSSIHAI